MSKDSGIVFPEQRIPHSKKDKEWRKNTVNYIINRSKTERYLDIDRMITNYNVLSSNLDDSDIAYICSTLGLSKDEGKKYVNAYNKTHNIYFSLKGEELFRPFSYRINNISPSTTNEKLRMEQTLYRGYVENVIEREIEIAQARAQLEAQLEQEQIGPSAFEKMFNRKLEDINKNFSPQTDINKIVDSTKNISTTKEDIVNKLIRVYEKRQKLKYIKNETWGDVVLNGKEVVEIVSDKKGQLPYVKQLNLLNVFYHKSPNEPFIHYSDYAGYVEEMTIGEALDKYHDKLTEEDYEKLKNFSYNYGGGYGTGDSLFHTRRDRHASSWHSKREAGIFPSGHPIDTINQILLDGKYMGVPMSGSNRGVDGIYGSGLYSDNYWWSRGYVLVYTTYWRSWRKLVEYTVMNPDGSKTVEVVDDSFVVPKNAKKEVSRDNMFGPPTVKKIWYDNGVYNSVEEIWLEEIWKGVRINDDIYVDIAPLESAYNSILTPYRQKLPIHGFIYNARNSGVTSIFDRIVPWHKLYLATMARFLKTMTQDRGVWVFLNTMMVDPDIGIENTIKMGEDLGIIPFNPFGKTKLGDTAYNSNLKPAEKVDMQNAEALSRYIEILRFIESQFKEVGGMSDTRMGEIKKATATETQHANEYSRIITETLFNNHDLLWEEILQTLMEHTLRTAKDNPDSVRGILNDQELAVLLNEEFNLEDEYLLQLQNNSQARKVLEMSKNLALTLVQNDKAKLSTLINLLEEEDLTEFKKYVVEVERNIEEREDFIAQREQEYKKELADKERMIREDEQIAKLDEAYLKGLMDEKREHVRGQYLVTSYNLQHDLDKDSESDLLENDIKYKKLISDIESKMTANQLRAEELQQRKKEHADNLMQKHRKMIVDSVDKEKDRKVRESKTSKT